jgi:hypothetical protein
MQPSSARMCPNCAGEIRDGWVVCPACAMPLQHRKGSETETVLTQSARLEEGRFVAGTKLAGRYRIIGLLGRGAMGEVYRADDLILNQAVALKFLRGPKMNEGALVRFRNEVRIARQISHPNVCRVYDIGFVEGFHFLSMEFLDGEDLDSLCAVSGDCRRTKPSSLRAKSAPGSRRRTNAACCIAT